MKKVYIIHRWTGASKKDWIWWLKEELEERGFEVLAPNMPNADDPKIEEWVPFLEEICPKPDKDTYFVGHSVSCQAIIRYVERMNIPIGGAVFVAPWFTLMGLESKEDEGIARPWVETPVDFEKVRGLIGKSVAFFSENDYFVPLEDNGKIFQEKLGSEIIVEKGMGHFTEDEGVIEVPSVLSEVLKVASY
jgi:uncharacterized protein